MSENGTMAFDPFAGPPIERAVPTTESQREIWTASRLGDDASLAFNESGGLRLRGALDTEALRGAWSDVLARHQALRATVSPDGRMLLIAPPRAAPPAVLDLAAEPAAERERRLEVLREGEVMRPFDLERGPLVRATLVRLAPDDHLLVFTAHHVVCDGYSTGVLLRELGVQYTARRTQAPAALPDVPGFHAWSSELEARRGGPEHAEDARYWAGRFAVPPPDLDLPTDRRRPVRRSFSAARLDHVLPRELVDALRRAGARRGASLFVTLLAGLGAVLHRLSGQDDLVVAIPSAGQATAGWPGLVGHCVFTLPVRLAVDGGASFAGLLEGTRSAVLDAQDHAMFTLGELIRSVPLPRDPSRLPLASVCFNLEQGLAGSALGFGGLEAAFLSHPRRFESFDLFLNAVELGGAVTLEIQYNTDLYDRTTIARWALGLETLLAAAGEAPETPVSRLPVLTDEDRRQLGAWNATDVAYAPDTLHALFLRQVARTPEATALRMGASRWSYRELADRALALAGELRAAGVRPGDRVGLYLERSFEMVTAIYGTMLAGAAYVPIDPEYPERRIRYMLEDARPSCVLTDPALAQRWPADGIPLRTLRLEQPPPASAEATAPVPAAELAYVIFTSGSTGRPKGVANSHRGIVNRVLWMQDAFRLTPADVVLQKTPYSFDVSVWEFFWPLCFGAQLEIAPPGVHRDPGALAQLIQRAGVTTLHFVPSMLQAFLTHPDAARCRSLRRVVCSGEALGRELARRFCRVLDAELDNLYGPTEAAVDVSWWRCRDDLDRDPVPIGRPIANTQLHVLDPALQPVPVGVAGELYIGGVQVALGYLGRPELTQERFIADPFRAAADARLYRTGDRARWAPDGTVEFLGRVDHQVKLRGLRIELGEIEAVLDQHPDVRQSVVTAPSVDGIDARLVAYVAARAAGRPEDLIAALGAHAAERLPSYMVPQQWVVLDALPVNANGKIDRKALPAPDAGGPARTADYVAPRTEPERRVAALWAEALRLPRIGIHDDFFRLGGHSLLAAQVIARLAREDGVAVPLRALFEAPTVAQFAPRLAGERRAEPIPRVPGEGPYSVSIMQQRVLMLEQLEPGRRIFNLPAAFRLRGALDRVALERALEAFCVRHESARTTFRWAGDEPLQIIGPAPTFSLEPVDLCDVDAAERESALERALLAAADEPFDLERGPLIRASLFRTGHDEHVLFVMPHHAIWDGWSFDLLVRDLDLLYGAFSRGEPPALPALTLRYADFAEWHRRWLEGPEMKAQVAYWHRELAGEIPPLDLPTDRPRTRRWSDAGATEWLEIPRGEADALTALARSAGVTLYVVLLAAFETLLHRYGGQDDILVGTPVRGRVQPEIEDVAGFFVNTLILRTRLDGDPTFLELVARVRRVVLDAFQHQDVPLELLATTRNPGFRALFSFQDARSRPSSLGALALSQVHVLPPVAANDVSLWVMEKDFGLIGGFNYSTTLYDRDGVREMLASLRSILRAVIADPSVPISGIELGEGGGRAVAEGGTAPAPEPLHAAFDRLAAAAPGAVAVTGEGASSRRDLSGRADTLARALRAAGAGPGKRVALHLDRPEDLAVALLGVSRAGAASVPLDVGDPLAHVAAVLAAAHPVAVVATSPGEVPADGEWRVVTLPPPGPAEAGGAQLEAADTSAAALVAYTSDPLGAGAPLGIELSHRAVAAAVDGVRAAAGLGEGDVLAVGAAAGAGRRALEVWLALLSGARLAPLERDVAGEGDRLRAALEASGATALVADVGTWRDLLDAGFRDSAFKALCGGEPLTADLAERLPAAVGDALVLYGAAECGFWAGAARLGSGTGRGRFGRPIPGVRFAIVDRDLRPVPFGVVGELVVAGTSLANGYADRPDATAARFVPDPATGGSRLFRTGDHARMRRDGTFEHLGRAGGAVQTGGRRMDPGEVERAMRSHPAVADAVVAAVGAAPDDRRIVAWWCMRKGEEATDAELRRHLRRRLPRHMVPQHLVEVEAITRGEGGVADRGPLVSPMREGGRRALPPRTPEESVVAEVWRSALGLEEIGVHDNFFDLGGHSLLCLQVVEKLAQRTGKRIAPTALLNETLELVAKRIGVRAHGQR